MVPRAPRFLLAFSSLLSAVGGVVHAAAFRKTLAAVAGSNLPPFFGNSLKMLWLGDSTTLFGLAAIFGLIAARPFAATRTVVVLLALIPAATAVLLYTFLGSFFAGHLLLTIAAAAFFAGLQLPTARVGQTGRTADRDVLTSLSAPVPHSQTR
jgi:hypothetical protein